MMNNLEQMAIKLYLLRDEHTELWNLCKFVKATKKKEEIDQVVDSICEYGKSTLTEAEKKNMFETFFLIIAPKLVHNDLGPFCSAPFFCFCYLLSLCVQGLPRGAAVPRGIDLWKAVK